jgi:hypothetical protein
MEILRNRWLIGGAVALLVFGVVGTVSALWANPFFMRMTPVGALELALLGALSLLSGLYVAIRRVACADYSAGWGGVLGFLGVACPVCNKLLMLLLGADLLLTYFEPIRLYVAAAGIALLAVALLRERLALHRESNVTDGVAPAAMTPAAKKQN